MGQMEKLRQRYYDIPLSGKVMLVFTVFLLIFCLVTQVALQLSLSVYDGKLYEKSLQELDYFSQGVNRSVEEFKALSAEIAMDDDIQELLVELRDMDGGGAAYSLGILELRELIAAKTNTNLDVRSAVFYDGGITDILVGTGMKTVPEKIRQVMEKPVLEARGGSVVREPDEQWPYFLVGRNILEKENARFTYLGTLLLCCDMTGVIRKNARSLEAEHASLCVYTDRFVIYQDEVAEGISFPACEEGKGYEIVRVGKERYFMCYLYSTETGWMYANVFPYTEIYGQVRAIRMILVAAIVLMALVFMAGMTGLVRTITRPLNELVRSMRIVETGDFQGAREELTLEERGDETGQLQKEFDTMLGRINELIVENYEKQLLLKDTSYRMLRAQINPHFIYNTLNTINWMVKWKKNEEVSKLIVEFGNMLRNSFAEDPFSTVEEETASVEGYMAIQSYRYQSRADFLVEKEGELEKYLTPRMILQPLVENAIYHGIENSLEKCTVRVSVKEMEDYIWYEVADDGPGMDEETLKAVRNGTAKSKGNGIGLANIRERIRLIFEDGEFMIDSVSGVGTRVDIRIPKKEVGRDV